MTTSEEKLRDAFINKVRQSPCVIYYWLKGDCNWKKCMRSTDLSVSEYGFSKKFWFTRFDKTDVVKGLMWFTH